MHEDLLGFVALHAAFHVYRAIGDVEQVFRVKRVIPRVHGYVSSANLDGVVSTHGILDARDDDGAAGDDRVVLGGDGMAVVAGHLEHTRPVDGQVVLGVQRGVRLVLFFGKGVARSVRKHVGRALGKREEDLVGLVDLNGGAVLVVDGDAVEYDLRLVVVTRQVHHDLAVG